MEKDQSDNKYQYAGSIQKYHLIIMLILHIFKIIQAYYPFILLSVFFHIIIKKQLLNDNINVSYQSINIFDKTFIEYESDLS
ncbi:hypothetical protein pb186bvf_019245 [Paramecium bursaria]